MLAEQTQRGRMNSTPYPHRSSGSQQMKNYDRTSLPYRAYCTDKGVPISICHFPADSPYTDTIIHHHHPWYRPGFPTPGDNAFVEFADILAQLVFFNVLNTFSYVTGADGGLQQGYSNSAAVREDLMESLVKGRNSNCHTLRAKDAVIEAAYKNIVGQSCM